VSVYHAELAARVEAQSLACIGCNDCLLSCPLVESRQVTIGELNAAVHAPTIQAANVAAFVSACTQCRQCVPVCPADLNRADMVLFNKFKIEDSVPDHELLLQARTVTIPSGWGLDELSHKLTHLELFAGSEPRILRRMLLQSTLRFAVPGEELCREGDFYERLALVLAGAAEQTSILPDGRHMRSVLLGPGGFFGEMGVLAGVPEAYGARAVETSVILEIPKPTLLRFMEQAPAFAELLSSMYARRALWNYARSPGALGVLPEASLRELMNSATLESLAPGDPLFQQGDVPRDFFLVHSGFLRVRRRDPMGERVLVYLREGELFGVFSVLYGEPAQPYAVEAATRAQVVRFSGQSLAKIVAQEPHARDGLTRAAYAAEQLARAQDVGMRPIQVTDSARSAASGGRLSSEVLVDQGIAGGREVLVIDQDLCTNCSNCIASCERRHGYSRLELRGLQVDHYLFPTACRHCEDPACLLCNVNGIVRTPTGEIKIVEDNCIGCGACAERCPYDNIQMHPAERPRRGVLFSVLHLLMGGEPRRQALAALDPKLKKVAVKCDLCADYSDYACVTGCPVGAAFRIDPRAALTRG
jgi:CRP-like cAMP-binding protein/Fe-S-cluster-containing dehydrogenase component